MQTNMRSLCKLQRRQEKARRPRELSRFHLPIATTAERHDSSEQVRVRTFSPPVVDHRLATHMRSDVLTRTTLLEV